MSNSRRKTSAKWTGADSEKSDKQTSNRRLRREVRECLQADPEDAQMPLMREVSNTFRFSKSSRYWFNEDENPQLMRK